jgi:predicted ATPase
MLTTLAVANYRSLRSFVAPLRALNVITGPNGSGKSNVYRALRLLAETAKGGVVAALSRDGGLESTLWAGPKQIAASVRRGEHEVQGGPRREPVQLRMGFSSDHIGYAIDLGLPPPSHSAFAHDPEIKGEHLWHGPVCRQASMLAERRGAMVSVRRDEGGWDTVASHLASFDGMLTQVADPQRAPELLLLRESMRSWRFYDHFRSDADAPARQPQLGTRTTALAHDGRDLAATLQTIREIGDPEALDAAIDDAFPGSCLEIERDRGRFLAMLRQHGATCCGSPRC